MLSGGKKMKWFKRNFLLAGCFLLASNIAATEQEALIIGTWGGTYEAAQQKAWYEPFTRQTNTPIQAQAHNGDIDVLFQDNPPDLIDMAEADVHRMCKKGLLEPLDAKAIVFSSPQNKKIEEDFMDDTFSNCGIAHSTISTLIAYNPQEFLGKKPNTIADFFDVVNYPGKRGLRKKPHDFLEWALLAEGIPASQVYGMLSTPRGMKLAFKQMDKIREHIVWWEWPHEPAELLQAGKVTMTSGFNGRFFAEQSIEDPIALIWDGQIIDKDVWTIPIKKNPHAAARKFIHFAMKSGQLARLAENIPYGPVRYSSMWQIGNHPESGTPMLDHLPTAPHHLKNAIFRDTQWYANTAKFREKAFFRWLTASNAAD